MGTLKNKQIEEKEMTMDQAVDFDLEQKHAMELFYFERDKYLNRQKRLDRLIKYLYAAFLFIGCLGLGNMLIKVWL